MAPLLAVLALAAALLPSPTLADYQLSQQMTDSTCTTPLPGGFTAAYSSYCVPNAAASTSTRVVW